MNFEFHEMSPEQMAMMRHYQDMHEMSTQDYVHQLVNLLKSVTEDDLRVLSRILLVTNSGNESFSHGYYQGLIASEISHRFDKCLCGEDHNEGIEKLTKQPDEELIVEHKDIPHQRNSALCSCSNETLELDGCICGIDAVNYEKNMKKYGLDTQHGSNILCCVNCKQPYISLADRMLRAPGKAGCEGCKQKEKWG